MNRRRKRIAATVARHAPVGPRYVHAILKIQGTAEFTVCHVESVGVIVHSESAQGTVADIHAAVHTAFRYGEATWAEDQDGLILYGIDPRGNRCDFELTSNIASIRAWHRSVRAS